MRVIGGELRSRRLKAVPGLATRPTPDRLREALFSILAPRIEGCVFIDAYAGSGAVGIEALSRGAARAIFIESEPAALRVLKENLRTLGLEGRATVVRGKVSQELTRHQGEIVFLDPPYEAVAEYDRALRILGQKPPKLVIVQHRTSLQLAERVGALRRVRTLRQGENALSFYWAATGASSVETEEAESDHTDREQKPREGAELRTNNRRSKAKEQN